MIPIITKSHYFNIYTASHLNLQQHVNIATHDKGHTLDLIITRDCELPIDNIRTDHSIHSDHFAILFKINLPQQNFPTKLLKCRKLGEICIDTFKKDLTNSTLYSDPAENLDDMVEQYN